MKPSYLLAGVASALCCVAWAKAPLVPLYSYHFDKLDSLNGIDGHNANRGSGTIPLTYKLWSPAKQVYPRWDSAGKAPYLDPVHGYMIQEDNWSSFWLIGDANEGLGCSHLTGFTLSFWVLLGEKPPAWTDVLGFRMGTEDVVFEFCSIPRGIQIYSNTLESLRKLTDMNAHTYAVLNANAWNHLCLVWHPYLPWKGAHYGELWVNGVKAGWVVPSSRMKGAVKELHLGAWVRRNGTDRGGSSGAGLADVELYGQAISDDDVGALYRRVRGPIPRGRETTVSLHLEQGLDGAIFSNSGTLTNQLYCVNGGFSNGSQSPGAAGSNRGLYSDKPNGEWMDGDETTGLGCSTATGFTLSYWVYRTAQNTVWSDILSVGLGNGNCNWRHEFTNQTGGQYYYGSCSMSGFSGGETNGKWNHHVLVFEPGQTTGQHWQDGKKNGTMTMSDVDSDVDSGVVRRLCIGPSVLKEDGTTRTQGFCNSGIDELGLFNFALTDDQVAWLASNQPQLPALGVSALSRSVSGVGAWSGSAAEWTVADTSRKLVWPAGEDADLTATVTATADATLAVDTVVAANVILTGADGTAVELNVAKDCAFSPASLSLADGLVVTLPNGTKVAGNLTLGNGTRVRLNAAGVYAGRECAVATGGFILPDDDADVLAHVEVVGADNVSAALSEDGKSVMLVGLGEDPTRKVISGAVALEADEDWTGYAEVLFADGATLDLAGHALTLRGFANVGTAMATVTDTVGNGRLVVDVPAGETARNENVQLAGGLCLVKNGAGDYVTYLTKCPYTGGTEINAGTVRLTAPYGYSSPFGTGSNSWVRVNEGGAFDINGTQDLSTVPLLLNGGKVVNASMRFATVMNSPNLPCLYNVRLERDSTFEFSETYGLRGTSGTGLTQLDLGGHKLTVKTGGNNTGFILNNCTVSAGEIEIVGGGYLAIGDQGVRAPQVKLTSDTAYYIGPKDTATATFADFTALGADASAGYSNGVVKVSGTFAPTGKNFPHVELADGGTLDLSGASGTVSALSNHTTGKIGNFFTVADGATSIRVNLAGRTDLAGLAASEAPYVMTWNGAPRPTAKFTVDDQTRTRYKLKNDATGLRIVERTEFYIILR